MIRETTSCPLTTSSSRQPLVRPSVHVLDETDDVAALPEVAGERQDFTLVHPAADDAVDLDRAEARALRGFEPLEDVADAVLRVGHAMKGRLIERIETQGEPIDSRELQRAGRTGE